MGFAKMTDDDYIPVPEANASRKDDLHLVWCLSRAFGMPVELSLRIAEIAGVPAPHDHDRARIAKLVRRLKGRTTVVKNS